MKDEIFYSKKIPGVKGNHNWPVQFSSSDGFLRIGQYHPLDGDGEKEAVLLSPSQIKAMLSFLKRPNTASSGLASAARRPKNKKRIGASR